MASKGRTPTRTAKAPAKSKPDVTPPEAKITTPKPVVKSAAETPAVKPAAPAVTAAKPVVPAAAPVAPAAKPAAAAKPAPLAAELVKVPPVETLSTQPLPKAELPAPAVPSPVVVAEPVIAEPVVKTPDPVTPDPVSIVEAAPTPDAPAPVATIEKEVTIMEANLKNAAEKAQTFFAEANDRAKAAVEKSTKLFEEANEFSKGNIEALVESGKIAAKGMETLGQEAAEYSRKQFEGATAALKSLSSIKTPTDFFKLHSDYVRSSFDAIVAQASKNTEAVLKLAGEVAQPLSNRVAIAAEKVKIAA